jgi:HK97 family phage prohead protease
VIRYREVSAAALPQRKRELAARALATARAQLLLDPIDLIWFEECTEAEVMALENGKDARRRPRAWERPHRRDGETSVLQPSDGRYLIRVRADLDDVDVVGIVLHECRHVADVDSGHHRWGRALWEQLAERYQQRAATLIERWENMSTKVFDLELKRVAEDGEFEGTAAVYEILDRNGDIIRRGAANKSIEIESTVPILDHHRPDAPLGVGFLSETWDGVKIRGRLELEVQRAREMRALIKSGAVTGLSIGFETLKHSWDGDTRILEEISVAEVSLVSSGFQAAAGAVVTGVKSSATEQLSADEERRIGRLLDEMIAEVRGFRRAIRDSCRR